MSLKGKIRICFLVYFCATGLTAAFNGQRKSSGDVSIQPNNGQHEETKDARIVPATPEETTQKRKTRFRRANERNRRDKEDQDAMLEIFSQQPTQSAGPQPPPVRTTQRSPVMTTTRRSRPARPVPIPQRPPPRPVVQEASQKLEEPGSEPSQGNSCIWAIVRCCSQVPRPVSVSRCFELFGCPGAYFDNPCESNIAKSISRAANEIQQNGTLFL